MASNVESQELSRSLSGFTVDLYQVITKTKIPLQITINNKDLIEHFIDYRNVPMNQPIKILLYHHCQ